MHDSYPEVVSNSKSAMNLNLDLVCFNERKKLGPIEKAGDWNNSGGVKLGNNQD